MYTQPDSDPRTRLWPASWSASSPSPDQRGGLRRWVRCVTILLAQVAAGIALTACQPVAAQPPITLVVTATASEPRPALPDSLRAELERYATSAKSPGAARVKIISSVDAPPAEIDLTPLRKNGEVEHSAKRDQLIREKIDALAKLVTDVKADRPGLDLLSLLDVASHEPHASLMILSSGLSTVAPVSWQDLGFSFDVDRVITAIQQQGRLPQLAGHKIEFYSLAVTAGGQERLPRFARDQVSTFWVTLCRRAGGTCGVEPSAPTNLEPLATEPVPLVPVPAAKTVDGCPEWLNLSDQVLNFAPDSAVLPASANAVLGKIVQDTRNCRLAVELTGHVADTHNSDHGFSLSRDRARAVASRLVELGLDKRAIGRVEGRGDLEPVINNWVNGSFDEARAKENRRVEINFQRA